MIVEMKWLFIALFIASGTKHMIVKLKLQHTFNNWYFSSFAFLYSGINFLF